MSVERGRNAAHARSSLQTLQLIPPHPSLHSHNSPLGRGNRSSPSDNAPQSGVRQSWPPNPGGHLHCPSYGLHSPELPQLNAGRRQLKQGGHSGGREGSPGRRRGGAAKEAPLARVIPSLVSSSSRVGTDTRSVLAEGPAAMSEGRARKRRGSGRGGSIMAGDGGGQRDGQ